MRLSKGQLKLGRKDLWNLDQTLSDIIYNALEQFKGVKKHSIPPHLYIDLKGDSICDPHSIEMTSKQFENEWVGLLKTMQDGFLPIVPYCKVEPNNFHWDSLNNPEMFAEKTYEWNGRQVVEWQRKLKDRFTDADYEAYVERQEMWGKTQFQRQAIGRRYFIAYFDNLWD